MGLIRAIARVMLGPVFISGGWDVLKNPEGRIKLAREAGTPEPELAVKANAAVMVGAGSFLMLGILPRLSAAVLAASMVPTTLAGHPFWKKEGVEQKQQLTQFLKNLAAIGGLLLVATDTGRNRKR